MSPSWLLYFDPDAALQSVINYIENLPSARYDRRTMRAYLTSLADYCRHLGATVQHTGGENYQFWFDQMEMPSRVNTDDYIASLKKAGYRDSTIARHLAAIHLYLNFLSGQNPRPATKKALCSVLDAQRQFLLIANLNNPADGFDGISPRLSSVRITQDLRSNPLAFKRNQIIAQMYLAGCSAERLARLTLASIHENRIEPPPGVRKRAPLPITRELYDLVVDFIAAWNAELEWNDLRRITATSPIFHPLLRSGSVPPVGLRGYNPQRGLSPRAILHILHAE